jgi:hypothetical protein
MDDDLINGLDFLEAHLGILNQNNKIHSLNDCIIPTRLSMEQEPLTNHICRVILPCSQVVPPNTIRNVPCFN